MILGSFNNVPKKRGGWQSSQRTQQYSGSFFLVVEDNGYIIGIIGMTVSIQLFNFAT